MSAGIDQTDQSGALLPLSMFTSWLANGERGLSSQAIVSHLTGQPIGQERAWGRKDHPYDPEDFKRCQLLLERHPLAKLVFPQMRTASVEWARLVDAWDEIHATIETELPGYLGGTQGSALRGYKLMKRVLADGTKCEACDGIGRAEPCSKCKGSGQRSGGRCRARGCMSGYLSCSACRGDGYLARVPEAAS